MIPPELRSLYPFRPHFLTLDGPRMHYVDEGRGPAVVMLHGNPTWSFYFRDLLKGLSDRFRVVAPDHIGCGLSEKPRQYPYILRRHIDNLERLIDFLDLRDLTLVVHDWGGAIGFGYACRHPERVRRFIIFNTAAFLGPVPFRIRVCGWPLLGEVAVRGLNLFAKGALRMACHQCQRLTPLVRQGYLLPYHSYASRVALLGFVRDIPMGHGGFALRGGGATATGDRAPAGKAVTTSGGGSDDPSPASSTYELIRWIDTSLPQFADRPMMIFWGMKDFCFHEGFLQGWMSRFPAAAIHRAEDAGHYVVEDAHERILPPVRAFLDRS